MLVACAAKLSLSSDLHVVRALKMMSRLAVLDADETIEVRKRGPGKRVSIKTLLVAVLVYHLHQTMRFKAGQNMMAVSGSPNHIKVSDGLARNIADLPASIIGNKDVWFDVLWMKVFEAYDCQPCLPGCFLTVGLPHDLHQAISEKYKHEFKDLAQKLRRDRGRMSLTRDEEHAIAIRASQACKNTLRQNSRKAFRRLIKDWQDFPQLAQFPELFRESAKTSDKRPMHS
jgi:hypothetical protein